MNKLAKRAAAAFLSGLLIVGQAGPAWAVQDDSNYGPGFTKAAEAETEAPEAQAETPPDSTAETPAPDANADVTTPEDAANAQQAAEDTAQGTRRRRQPLNSPRRKRPDRP